MPLAFWAHHVLKDYFEKQLVRGSGSSSTIAFSGLTRGAERALPASLMRNCWGMLARSVNPPFMAKTQHSAFSGSVFYPAAP
eukprot:scaffold67771_cov18-Prasinocladus_malaysianus.AAC.1